MSVRYHSVKSAPRMKEQRSRLDFSGGSVVQVTVVFEQSEVFKDTFCSGGSAG